MTRLLLWAGAVGAALFVAAFLVEGATRPGYDVRRLPVSMLANGPGGWVQVANFIGFGVAMLAMALGLHRALVSRGWPSRAGPMLLGVFALGLLGAGVFATDPALGYPPGRFPPLHPSLHSTMHDVCSLVVFTTLPAACFVLAHAFARHGAGGWAWYSVVTGSLFAGGFVVLVRAYSGGGSVLEVAGLIQRVVLAIGWTWLFLVAIHFAAPTESPARSAPANRNGAEARIART